VLAFAGSWFMVPIGGKGRERYCRSWYNVISVEEVEQ
jgi:hypothetical protein